MNHLNKRYFLGEIKNVECITPGEIRFRFQDVKQPDELIEIAENDINITTNRYQFHTNISTLKQMNYQTTTDKQNRKLSDNKLRENVIKIISPGLPCPPVAIFAIGSIHNQPYFREMISDNFPLLW